MLTFPFSQACLNCQSLIQPTFAWFRSLHGSIPDSLVPNHPQTANYCRHYIMQGAKWHILSRKYLHLIWFRKYAPRNLDYDIREICSMFQLYHSLNFAGHIFAQNMLVCSPLTTSVQLDRWSTWGKIKKTLDVQQLPIA